MPANNFADMVCLQRVSSGYAPKGGQAVKVATSQLARMSKLITVECIIGHALVKEQLVGYREADTGCVMVSYEQFNTYFVKDL